MSTKLSETVKEAPLSDDFIKCALYPPGFSHGDIRRSFN